MKKFNLLFISAIILLLYGCAFEERVDTFYEMGCSSSFSDIFLTKGTNVSTTYPLQVVLGLNCNEDVSVTIKFYDNGYPGHYKYFLVNGIDTVFKEVYYTTDSLKFLFVVDPVYENLSGTFYGTYRVTAINQDSGLYTSFDYNITAYDGRQN